MAVRKKVDSDNMILKLGKSDKLMVQKSLPLFALWQSELTLAEFKILDTYLARINSHEPEKRIVMFSKGELERLLGVKKINNRDLERRLMHLMASVVKLPDSESLRGFRLITLFEEAVAEQDDDGIWQVKLECTQKAMKYFFNVENLGYLRYKLRCITSISSRYAYIMFCYLEQNRWRKTWEEDLERLKVILGCESVETYFAYKEFNKQLLKRVQTELHEKTECRYSYEPVKVGRSVKRVRFTLETKTDYLQEGSETQTLVMLDPSRYTLEEWKQMEERDHICCGFSDPVFDSFSVDELRVLKELAFSKKRESDVQRHLEVLDDMQLACDYATADYLRMVIVRAKVHKPRNLFAYIESMLLDSL